VKTVKVGMIQMEVLFCQPKQNLAKAAELVKKAVLPDRDPVKEPYGNEWHVPYSHLSSIYHIPVIGVSNVGQVTEGSWKGWKAIGNSIAYGRDGNLLKVLPYGEEAECVEVITVETEKEIMCGTKLSEYVYERIGYKVD